jgi:site-specific DNA-methyltransferase (cytosine-N4-specific)
MTGRALVGRADARRLPLADGAIDLFLTSPPYYGHRDYSGQLGQPWTAQIGHEPTAAAYLESLWECTAEMARCLAPGGSMFVNLGDKRIVDNRGSAPDSKRPGKYGPAGQRGFVGREMGREGSKLMLPQRYAIGCMDRLGLIVRSEIIWSKPWALSDNAQDRVQDTHEHLFHLTRDRRYYHDLDAIRVPHAMNGHDKRRRNRLDRRLDAAGGGQTTAGNGKGKIPGSVWEVRTVPLNVPPYTALGPHRMDWLAEDGAWSWCRGTGTWSSRLPRDDTRCELRATAPHHAAFPADLIRPVILAFSPPGGKVADSFGGTGTVALVAATHGRDGISFDASRDYGWLARWRTTDPRERARVRGLPLPARTNGPFDLTLFDLMEEAR